MEAYVCVALHSVQNTLLFGSRLASVLELRNLFVSIFQKRKTESQKRISDLPKVIKGNLQDSGLWLEFQVLSLGLVAFTACRREPSRVTLGLVRLPVPAAPGQEGTHRCVTSHSAQGLPSGAQQKWNLGQFYCCARGSLRSSRLSAPALSNEQASPAAE